MIGSMSQTILLKTISSMAKGYFDKNPTAELKISVNTVADYVKSNYPEFKVEVKQDGNDTKLILSKK